MKTRPGTEGVKRNDTAGENGGSGNKGKHKAGTKQKKGPCSSPAHQPTSPTCTTSTARTSSTTITLPVSKPLIFTGGSKTDHQFSWR
ncbi:hypothetical protein E2C01_085930 [Portunus trituberculatus]|uniref:Uncharacterized protein n=1 Tax=Portunus trituberculatus TaxID=210409 RepID=A0A5B7JA78_PORTR|nr:hypothetical protein [Portunus trituberculatus]